MAATVSPAFFIFVGVLVFIDGGIVTVLMDEYFPGFLPYVLLAGAFFGFALLTLGPSFLTSLSRTLQFDYSLAYSLVAVLCLLSANLFLLFARRRALAGGVFAIVATIPSILADVYYANAYVQGTSAEALPRLLFPLGVVYTLLVLAAVLLFSLLVATVISAARRRHTA